MPVLRIRKENRQSEPVKSTTIYLSTHERIAAFSEASGQSITRLLKICVDFALDNAELIDESNLKIKGE